MKVYLLSILSVFFVLIGSGSAFAQVRDLTDLDLTDYLSPDEIAEELGITGDEAFVEDAGRYDRLHIVVDKAKPIRGQRSTAQTMDVYLDGEHLYRWKVSTGRERPERAKSGRRYFSRTPVGTFRIQRRVVNHWSVTWQAPMPYAQFFTGGIAIHATTRSHEHELGTRASGGCVRLKADHAEALWDLVSEVGARNTVITVVNSLGN